MSEYVLTKSFSSFFSLNSYIFRAHSSYLRSFILCSIHLETYYIIDIIIINVYNKIILILQDYTLYMYHKSIIIIYIYYVLSIIYKLHNFI